MTKTSAKKNTQKQKRGTLDQQHTDKLQEFERKSNSLPKKRKKLAIQEKELSNLNTTNPSKYTHDDIHRKAYLLDSIDKLKLDIHRIENCTDSLNYIVDVLPILIDYYDNKEIIDDGMEEDLFATTQGTKKTILTYLAREASIQEKNKLDMLALQAQPPAPKANGVNKANGANKANKSKVPAKRPTRQTKKMAGSKSAKYVAPVAPTPPPIIAPKISRAKLYENYLCVTDTTYKKPAKPKDNSCIDPNCPGEKIICQNDGCITCNECGISEKTLMVMEKPNYKEPTQDNTIYAYKRINHLTEILSQLQAKESTDIPPKIFESILREIKKRKIDKNDLDIFRLRRILKNLNFIKYYEHVPHILQIINGKQPPNFSRSDEAKIKNMFKNIQKAFAIFCPKTRKNFLNYSYVLHKFCELLDLDDYIAYFPLLKNNSKLLQHDKIWKNICAHMQWKFYKSI